MVMPRGLVGSSDAEIEAVEESFRSDKPAKRIMERERNGSTWKKKLAKTT